MIVFSAVAHRAVSPAKRRGRGRSLDWADERDRLHRCLHDLDSHWRAGQSVRNGTYRVGARLEFEVPRRHAPLIAHLLALEVVDVYRAHDDLRTRTGRATHLGQDPLDLPLVTGELCSSRIWRAGMTVAVAAPAV